MLLLSEPVHYLELAPLELCSADNESMIYPGNLRAYARHRADIKDPVMTGFLGGVTLDSAKHIIRAGSKGAGHKLDAIRRELSGTVPTARCIRRMPAWGPDGDEVDYDRVRAGNLEACWRTSRRKQAVGSQVVSLLTSWGGRGNRSIDELYWSSACGIVLADIMEAAGYRVELRLLNAATFLCPGIAYTSVLVKQASQPVDVDAFASIGCIGGVFRSLGILARLRHKFRVGNLGATEDINTVPLGLEGALGAGAVLVRHAWTKEQAIEACRVALSDIGGSRE